MAVKYHIGCSGFHYEEWKERFYPPKTPKTKWLEYYAAQFNTVELNVTFYRIMKQSFFENLYSRVPVNFQFSVKASRIVTHYKKFNDVNELLTDFYTTIKSGLREKLGAVLFQLPPAWSFDQERLERIIRSMDPAFRNVTEFRHETWWNKAVKDQLGKSNICFCTVSYPGLPDELVINGPIVYIRLHGVPVLYRSRYQKSFLEKIAKQLQRSKVAREVYIYFDNTDRGEAIHNAREMTQLLGK